MNARRAMWLAGSAATVATLAFVGWRMLPSTTGRPGPAPAAESSRQEFPACFEEITATSGVDFQHWCGAGGRYFFPEVMGSGIGLIDYDRDGDLDLFVVQGMPPGENGQSPAGASAGSRLFRQEADGRFVDVTVEAGLVDHEPYGMGVAVGDVNNDGWPDLYVSKYGRDRLLLNRQGRFEDVTQQAGIHNPRWGTSVCFLDYDRDGWLDLFVVNYVDYFPSRRCINASGQEDYCHPNQFGDAPAKLYRNVTGELAQSGDEQKSVTAAVRFRDVSLEMGIDDRPGPGLGVIPGDFNADGWTDLYVANDAKANYLWINQQGTRFQEEAIPAGAAYDKAGKPQSSMGITSGDVNGDGLADLFMTHLDGEYSTLYLQIAPGNFEDRTTGAGLAAGTIPYTGFGTALCDLDLDGHLDLAIANGRVRRREQDRSKPVDAAAFWQGYAEKNQLFIGRGDGTFVEVAAGSQPFCSQQRVMRGLAVGDLDGDGNLDIVTSEINGPARIFRNVALRKGNWLLVQAVDPRRGSRDAYGAVVTLVAGKKRWSRDINPAFSYLSSSDPRAHFGLGKLDAIDQILVRWPDGSEEVFPGGPTNRLVTLRQGAGAQP